ncbi:MAG TPA: hypothetical protein VLT33_05850 [Labilithrix sp.]|nr:hypothetical protein [Labilithrix sp.]
MRHPAWAFLFFSVCTSACGNPEPEVARRPVGQPLPLRSMRLYETGVGYFERSGTIGDRALTSLPVPAGHLDDALKSLVVLNGGGGGTVTGVAFASSVTRATARSRAGLPADPDHPIAFKDLLVSMKGELVTVSMRGATTVSAGRVIEVTEELDEAAMRAHAMRDSKADKDASGAPPELKRLTVTLLTDKGEVMIVDAQDIAKIRPSNAEFAGRLDAALDALSTRSAQNARPLTLLGDARGSVTFGYIAETPIWRSTYRLIVASGAKDGAQLQGWALVHNDTDERWQGVHLELVNGEPDSFLFPLAAPRYARRTLLAPESQLSTLPQLQGTSADALWGDHLDPVTSGTGSGMGYGSGQGRLGGSHAAQSPTVRMGATSTDTRGSSVLSVGNLADLAPAQGVENGAQFVYAVPGAFVLDAHTSALVPFVSKPVQTENIAFFGEPGGSARAAVRFVNSTGQTLPAGTLAVFGAGGFAGETLLDRLKPGERRFLQVGNDLDAEVTPKERDRKEESKRLTFSVDRLEEHFLATSSLTWELENRGGVARTFYVALAADRNATVTGADRVDFDETSSRPIVVFDAPPKSKAPRKLAVVEGLSRSTPIDGLTGKLVHDLLQKATLPAAELAILTQAEPRVRALEAERAKTAEADKVSATVQKDLERLREHMKALGGGEKGGGAGTAAAPLVKRVLEAEDRLEAARRNKEAAAKELDTKRDAVREVLGKLRPR